MTWRQYLPIGFFLFVALPWVTSTAAQTPSKSTYLKLISVQKLWEIEDYSAALTQLREHAMKTDKNPHDHAIVHQYIAQTAIFLGEAQLARAALETALAVSELPENLEIELKLFYGQLVLREEEYELARQMLEDWYVAMEVIKRPAPVFSLAYANYQTRHMARAEVLLVEAIDKSARPPESWYRLYYQVLFDQKKHQQAKQVLLAMLNRNPGDDSYWHLLANHHLQLEDYRKALAALAISYHQNLLKGADDHSRLVSLYGFVEIPEKAARLLEQHLNDGVVPDSPQALKQLGDLYLVAREREKAKIHLTRAAGVAPDGKTYELLAGIYFEDEDWRRAHESYLKALNLGGVSDVPQVYLLAGVSALRAGMSDAARAALNEARKSERLRPQAVSLLKRLGDS